KQWVLEAVSDPAKTLPNIIVGPYQGWSKFFDNKLVTTFEEAMEIPEFFEWCQAHDRVVPLAKNFPLPTKLIVLRKENGQLIHIEGGHRICAVAFANKIGKPIDFSKSEINIAVATINDEEIPQLLDFLRTGSSKN
ncbi:MAG TPA: hypothetical protein PKD79_02975, partial [Candidatus Doudnabacteria bacterium]|nr:hypothetical protein [Candidatus Doudnabacteria bacterium]